MPKDVEKEAKQKRGTSHDLTLTRLGKTYPALYRQCRVFRANLELEVLRVYGSIDAERASLVNLAARMEMYAKIAEDHIKKGDIPGDKVVGQLKTAAEFLNRRHTAVRRLKLTGMKERDEAADDWEEVDAMLGEEGGEPAGDDVS